MRDAEDRHPYPTLPVNLLLKGRLCLLLGAGHVAHRKCRTLLAHGARVILVAPSAGEPLRKLAEEGRVEVRTGRYDASLLLSLRPFLVYAATNDDAVNRRITADAARLGILASSVSCWEEGDFISPSVIRWGRGQVSITTEGASCRQAKFMRLRLEDLLGGERELFLLGVDHRSLSLDEFESVRPDGARFADLVAMLRHLAALEEFVLLATCNRLELYAWTRPEEGLVRAAARLLGLDRFGDRAYVRTGEEVVEHAANVVAGHFSQVVCETQIVAQWKEAFRRAFSEATAGAHLQNLHDRALRLSKKIRALHDRGAKGLPELVAAVVREKLLTAGPRVLLLGAGMMGREVAERLAGIPGLRLSWANRTASRIPESPPGSRLPLDRALAELGSFDQVIAVLGVPRPVIRREHLEGVRRPPVLIDLGLPRNVDPALAAEKGVEVLGLLDFSGDRRDREALLALTRACRRGNGGGPGGALDRGGRS